MQGYGKSILENTRWVHQVRTPSWLRFGAMLHSRRFGYAPLNKNNQEIFRKEVSPVYSVVNSTLILFT